MPLYLIKRQQYDDIGWDEYDAHVIAARNVDQCRAMCPVADEGRDAWAKAKVRVLASWNGEPEVILSSFNAA